MASTGTGGSGNGNGKGGSNGTGGRITIDAGGVDLPDTITMTCGNGQLDNGEKCDDGNKMGGDGCTPLCQIEKGWICPNVGQACSRNNICGDGILTAPEACDDGNKSGGDGCAADCLSVDTGWRCPVPGKACIPICGDNVIEGSEKCDDGNAANGDGCSSTCQVEPASTCPTTSSGAPMNGKCTTAICGNGMKEAGEACDCGTDPTKFPTGCTGPNGLFNGDGTGCSKTCTKEPICRNSAGKTQACSVSCGNGNIETGEDCDDGNAVSGDGCSATCKKEAGFTCKPVTKDDAVDCMQSANSGGKCLELPIKYRDYKNESVSGGHPDFFFLGATVPNPVSMTGVDGQTGAVSFSKRYCVSNSSGPAKKNDSVNRCWDLAQANLDVNGKPQFNATRTGGLTCPCQFIDWDHDGNGGHVPGIVATASPTNGLTYTNGASGHPMYRGPAPIVASAASFGDGSATAKGWWTENTYNGSSHTIGTLELAAAATPGQYQFSSQPNSVLGGFFPLDPPGQYPLYGTAPAGPGAIHTIGTEAMLCNLWPYWYAGVAQTGTGANHAAGFGAANGCMGDQYLFPPSLMTSQAGPFVPANWNTTLNAMFMNGTWYPANVNDTPEVQGWYHDSWFSDEARYLFTYNGPFTLDFYGDDDMFIFVNGILMIDLGGVHQRLPGEVKFDGSGNATIIEGGSLNTTGTAILPCATTTMDPYTMLPFNTMTNSDGNGHSNCTNNTCDCRNRTLTAAQTGMTTGNTYEIAIFGADRHPTESNYQLTLSGFSTNQTQCGPSCGDGVQTGGEECDCGSAGITTQDASCNGKNNDDSAYNGCTTSCHYGPFCGDMTVNGPEQCDDGANNGVAYKKMCNSGGCTSTCTLPSCCGDTVVDTDEGEECDLGSANGTSGSSCTADCKISICLDPPCS